MDEFGLLLLLDGPPSPGTKYYTSVSETKRVHIIKYWYELLPEVHAEVCYDYMLTCLTYVYDLGLFSKLQWCL